MPWSRALHEISCRYGNFTKNGDFFREQGYEAVLLHEEGFDRLEDPAILAKAREEGFILLKDGSGFALFPCGRRSNYHQAKA